MNISEDSLQTSLDESLDFYIKEQKRNKYEIKYVDDDLKQEIEYYVDEILNLVKNKKMSKAFVLIREIDNGHTFIKSRLGADHLPLVENKFGLKNIVRRLYEEGFSKEADEFGKECQGVYIKLCEFDFKKSIDIFHENDKDSIKWEYVKNTFYP